MKILIYKVRQQHLYSEISTERIQDSELKCLHHPTIELRGSLRPRMLNLTQTYKLDSATLQFLNSFFILCTSYSTPHAE